MSYAIKERNTYVVSSISRTGDSIVPTRFSLLRNSFAVQPSTCPNQFSLSADLSLLLLEAGPIFVSRFQCVATSTYFDAVFDGADYRFPLCQEYCAFGLLDGSLDLQI